MNPPFGRSTGLLVLLFQRLCDGQSLDLVSAFKNLEYLCIAHELFDRVFLAVSISAEYLNCIRSDLLHTVGNKGLGNSAFLLYKMTGIHELHRVIYEAVGGFDFYCHIGKQLLNHLEFDEGLPELLTLHRPLLRQERAA